MNASNAAMAELAIAPGGSPAGDRPPAAPAGPGPVQIWHLGMAPSVHPQAYVAPTAVLKGQVSVGPGSCIMHGAVLAAEGGPVQVGAGCVIMENAVLRGTARHRPIIGDGVLAGPHTQLTGCTILPFIFGVDDAGGRCEQLPAALTHYTAVMARHHRQDQII